MKDQTESSDQEFLEILPTSEETVSSQDNDPFADIFEPDSQDNKIDPNDPFAELLGDGSEQPDEEFLDLLQADDNINPKANQSEDSQWDNMFDDTSSKKGDSDNPFLMEEMLETSKTHQSS